MCTKYILCEESTESDSNLLADYKKLNHDLIEKLIQLEQTDSSNESDDDILTEKRYPKWGGNPKSLLELKKQNYDASQNEKRFPKWRTSELKSRLNSPQKFEPYHGDRNPLRKIWEKNLMEKNKIYEKNNLI